MELVLLKFFAYFIFPVLIICDCSFNTENEVILLKEFGFKKMITSTFIPNVKLRNNENVQVYCNNQLIIHRCGNYYGNLDDLKPLYSIELHCDNGQLQLIRNGSLLASNCHELRISCSESNRLNLYESRQKLPNCDKYMSMGIGMSFSEFYEVSGAICYDWENLSLKFVSYLTSTSNADFKLFDRNQRSKTLDTVTLDKPLHDYQVYFHLMSESLFQQQLQSLKLSNSILDFLDFEYSSITEVSKFAAYDDILNIVWWRNLRQGNWRRYQEILKQRANSVQYLVYLGTDGIINIPQENFNKIQTLLNAPEYIWSYLISTNSTQEAEELVIVAYNSPFIKLNEESPIFCRDICDEVAWLNSTTFMELRLIPIQGVMFCCHPEDVSKNFASFPKFLNQKILTTSTPNYEVKELTNV